MKICDSTKSSPRINTNSEKQKRPPCRSNTQPGQCERMIEHGISSLRFYNDTSIPKMSSAANVEVALFNRLFLS